MSHAVIGAVIEEGLFWKNGFDVQGEKLNYSLSVQIFDLSRCVKK